MPATEAPPEDAAGLAAITAAAAAQHQAETEAQSHVARHDGRPAEMTTTLTWRSAGVWTPRMQAHQYAALCAEFSSNLVAYWRARALHSIALFTGLLVAWVEAMRWSEAPPAHGEFNQLVLLLDEGRICLRLRGFPRRPDALQPIHQPEADGVAVPGCIPVSNIISIWLPRPVWADVAQYAAVLQAAHCWTPYVFHPTDTDQAAQLSYREILKRLHQRISRTIDDCGEFHPAQAHLSFMAACDTAGVDPVIRLYVDQRPRPVVINPAWYSVVNAKAVEQAHAECVEKWVDQVQAEWHDIATQPIPEPAVQLPARRDVPDIHWGTVRCPTPDLLRACVAVLQSPREPIWTYSDISPVEARFNRAVEEAAFAAILFHGLRDFEVGRIEPHWFDAASGTCAIEGKGHLEGGMGRLIPWAAEAGAADARMGRVSGTHLYQRYIAPGQLQFVTSGDLQALFNGLTHAAGYGDSAPDVYGLRQAFRTLAVQLGLPFFVVNYLMGHQLLGSEYTNPWLDAGWPAVIESARKITESIATVYGWRSAKEQNS